jgi:hypothetical protein
MLIMLSANLVLLNMPLRPLSQPSVPILLNFYLANFVVRNGSGVSDLSPQCKWIKVIQLAKKVSKVSHRPKHSQVQVKSVIK